jgi:hypothetical protein
VAAHQWHASDIGKLCSLQVSWNISGNPDRCCKRFWTRRHDGFFKFIFKWADSWLFVRADAAITVTAPRPGCVADLVKTGLRHNGTLAIQFGTIFLQLEMEHRILRGASQILLLAKE